MSAFDYAFWIMVAYAIIVCGGIVFINWYTTRNNKYPGRSPDVYIVNDNKEEPDALLNVRRNFWS